MSRRGWHVPLFDWFRNVTSEFPEKFLEGVRLFNEEQFFECHDVLEELWSETVGEENQFYQGLIQAAVALFHFGNENLGGAIKLYGSARKKLEPYGLEHMGIELAKFLEDFRYCFEDLLQETETYPAGVRLRDERIPRIRFSTAADE